MNSDNESEIVTATSEKAKEIRTISRDTVHRICSGQVVLSLAVAVKELVENAIDAGATNVEIRLKEYGSESIEVIDNGSGVEECNFAALTLKHHTSKLRDFSDLATVSTLGFRGEALSSLCALSCLTIITRHTSAERASRIEYDHNGHIRSQTHCARQIGTTVSLSNLFSSLPVRHKEFLKNLKREFSKMCQLLYAYCIVAENVRIHCTNQTKKGARSTVVSTQGKNFKENIISLFGLKQMDTLIDIKFHEPDEKILEDFTVKRTSDDIIPFTFNGFISKCSHGSGRSTSDRQFYYINSRPCEPTKIMKLINEVYKYFNANQYPFVYLNITTEQSLLDVNVTPDKRQVFMENEKLLLATIKTSLLEMFKDFPSTFKMQNLNHSLGKPEANDDKKTVSDVFKEWSNKNEHVLTSQSNYGVKRAIDAEPKKKGVMAYIYEKRLKLDTDIKLDLSEDEQNDKSLTASYSSSDNEPDDIPVKKKSTLDRELKSSLSEFKKESSYKITIENSSTSTVREEQVTSLSQKMDKIQDNITSYKSTDEFIIDEDYKSQIAKANIKENNVKVTRDCLLGINIDVDVSIDAIRNLVNKNISKSKDKKATVVKFRSEITSDKAEQELQKQISKDMFEKMDIIGQFNKGFIIAKLDADIFIIDQHATDEKYNFETLQKTTVLQNQQLVNPKQLDLTAANELLLIEHLEIFTKNGFTFNIDANAEPRKKVSLTAIPVSKNWEFGKEDIDELLFMLQEDSSYENCRPSRVRAMFASRACRKSVMIGSALSMSDMRKLIDHMGQIDQPWNCPHGRPTMRHLVNLDLLQE
ncbi:Pms2 [Carabus blaptoides fortunei]